MDVENAVRTEQLIAAPREEVFRAWTEPEQLKQWWGPGGYTTQYAEVDLRAGGRYLLVMQPPRRAVPPCRDVSRDNHSRKARIYVAMGVRRPGSD